jgi:hypothetical protein
MLERFLPSRGIGRHRLNWNISLERFYFKTLKKQKTKKA